MWQLECDDFTMIHSRSTQSGNEGRMLKTDEAVVVDVAERKKSAWASTSASSNQKRSRLSQLAEGNGKIL